MHRIAICNTMQVTTERYRESDNLVGRLNLSNVKLGPEQQVEVHALAVRGLRHREPDPEKQLKHLDFIDICTGLDDSERERYQREYADEANTMSIFAE
jgi:hypothetical protein